MISEATNKKWKRKPAMPLRWSKVLVAMVVTLLLSGCAVI